MKCKVPCLCALGGFILGGLFAYQVVGGNHQVGDQEPTQIRTVTSIEARTQERIVNNVISSFEFPSWLGKQQGSPEKWNELLKNYAEDDRSIVDKRLRAEVIASLVKPEEFADVMDLIRQEELQQEGTHQVRKALYMKWLDNDPEGLEVWLGALGKSEQAESLAFLVTNVPQRHEETALELYENYQGNLELLDFHHHESTRRLLSLYSKQRGATELWQVYDKLPKSFTKNALYDIGKSVSKEEYPEFISQFSQRLESDPTLGYQFERAIGQWSQKAPEAVIDWLERNESLEVKYQGAAITSIYRQGHDKEFPEIAERVKNNPEISRQMVKEITSNLFSKSAIEEAKKVFDRLPEGAEYDMKDLQQSMRSLAYNRPMLIPEFVSILPSKVEQVELLEGFLNQNISYMAKSSNMNQYDLNVFREGLSRTQLDKKQQNLIMHSIRIANAK